MSFFDPENGEVRICDNDNVSVNNQATGAVSGTPRFMAPEIVRGELGPSTQTDLFSLAVLLFYMLVNHHPLEGARESQIRCLDLPAMTRLYGTDPLFIFDVNDDSNRPVSSAAMTTRWRCGRFILTSFRNSFFRPLPKGCVTPMERTRGKRMEQRPGPPEGLHISTASTAVSQNFHDP